MINMTQTSAPKAGSRENLAFANLNQDLIQKILRNVVQGKGFFFYEDVGKPIGDFATSLSEFCNKINTISSKSLVFHLKRGDFENWIRETIGDAELSDRIKKFKTRKTIWKNDASLRTKLHSTVRDRIAELQDLWHHSLKWPEAWSAKP